MFKLYVFEECFFHASFVLFVLFLVLFVCLFFINIFCWMCVCVCVCVNVCVCLYYFTTLYLRYQYMWLKGLFKMYVHVVFYYLNTSEIWSDKWSVHIRGCPLLRMTILEQFAISVHVKPVILRAVSLSEGGLLYSLFFLWVSDCCLTPIQQFFSYIMARTS
jgi:hypothetical protein